MSTPLFAVILAGGRGTRFWPRSRRARPKQFLPLSGGRTLLQMTVDRVAPMVPLARTLVVTTRDLAREVRRDLPRLPRRNLVMEPDGRNTAPAIGLAALHALAREEDPAMVVLPSDHYVAKPGAFRRAVRSAVRVATRDDRFVTFGIRPTRPETGYGYIRAERPPAGGPPAPVAVKQFIEKPPLARARRLARSDGVYWNSGIFIWKARTFLDSLARHEPGIGRGLSRIGRLLGKRGAAAAIDRIYARLKSVSVDYAVLERERRGRLSVLPVEMEWSDLGSWVSLSEVLARDRHGNVLEGAHLGIDTRGSILLAPGKLVASVGIENLIVVDTPDVLFLCPAGRAQEVRKPVALLRSRGMRGYS